MVANIYKDNVMLAEKRAWHGIGTVVENAFSLSDVMEKCPDINFEVEKKRLSACFDDGYRDIPAWGTFRKDNGEFLGTVGAGYKVIQVQYGFEFIDALLEAENGAHYESAGVLGKGEKYWISARIPMDFTIGEGDRHQTYLFFGSSHNGTLATIAKLILTRVVCENTLTIALREAGNILKIKHTKNANDKLEAAKKMLGSTAINVKRINEKLTALAERKLDRPSLNSILDRVFDLSSGKDKSKTMATIDHIVDRFLDNDGNAFPEQRGTAYNLLNAMTNWADHKRPVRRTEARKNMSDDQLRAESSIFGTSEQFKSNALKIIDYETRNCSRITPAVYSIPAAVSTQTGEEILSGLLDN